MKLLLDENLPHRLRPLLTGHEVFTVAYMNWKGIENGQLLALAAENGFEALITKDSGIRYEQNLGKLPCAVIILQAKSNSIRRIQPLVPALLASLSNLTPRSVIRIP
jgi:predicted nuclease of predicted toxin-antitoxin system